MGRDELFFLIIGRESVDIPLPEVSLPQNITEQLLQDVLNS